MLAESMQIKEGIREDTLTNADMGIPRVSRGARSLGSRTRDCEGGLGARGAGAVLAASGFLIGKGHGG